MSRTALVRAALLATLVPALATAQVSVARRDTAALRVRPGESATAVFRVTNAGAAVVVHPAAAFPRGWTPVAPEGAAELDPGARSIRLVGFAVPRDARAGSYFVRLGLRGLPARDSVRVVVAERRALAMRVDGAPRFAVAGEPYTLRFMLENRGNAAERVALRISGSPGASLPAAEAQLAAGETREIPVRVTTGRGATLRHEVEVRAHSRADSAVRAAARAGVDVVVRGGSGAARGRLPVEVRVRNGVLPAVSGSGSLARGGASRVDFLFRPADAPGALRGQQDEYRVRVAGRGMELLLGDQVYALSPLTQPGRYGFGAGGSVAAGPLSAGGYVARDRRSATGAEERGGQVALALGGAGSVGAQYLSGTDGTAASARARLAPSRLLAVDAEAGRGHGPRGAGSAESLTVHGGAARASWFARHLRADSAYPATFAGERVDEASVSLRPAGGLLVSGTAVRQRGGTARDLLLGSVGYAGMAAEYRGERGEGWSSRSVAVRGRYRAGPVWISPLAEVGTRDDSAASAPFHRVSAYGGVDVGRQSLSASFEHSSGRSADPLAPQDAFQAALHAALYPAPGTRVDASLQGSRGAGPGEWRSASAEAGVSQRLPRGHRLLARVRWMLAGPGSAGAPGVLLEYVIPIGVPVARGGEGGRVSGRVFDAESGRGVAGVPVRLGTQVALTDHAGTWRFANVRPGAHPLEVDRLGAGLERVPVRPIPASVEVRDGRAVRVDVGLVRSARVWGAVRVFDFAEASAAGSGPPPTVESGGLRDALLVLSAGDEAHRRSTDAAGRFEMADLRPGRWTLRVEHADLPAHHRLERDSAVLEVSAGSSHEVLLRVLPRFRPVRIIAGGEVRAADAAAAPPRPAPAAAPPRVAALPVPAPAAPRVAQPVPPPSTMRPAPSAVASSAPAAVPPAAPRPAPPASTPRPAPQALAARTTPPAGHARAVPPAAAPRTAASGGLVRTAPPRPAAPRPSLAPAARAEVGASGFTDWPHTTYTVQHGDRSLTDIAYLTYRDGTLWPRLFLANRHILVTPSRLVPGQVLVIPPPGPLTPAELAAMRQYRAGKR